VLATSSEPDQRRTAEVRFWELYWGELAMVENGGFKAKSGGVEGAMVRFGEALLKNSPPNLPILQQRSLELAHVCRDSLAESWGVRDWRTPSYGPTQE